MSEPDPDVATDKASAAPEEAEGNVAPAQEPVMRARRLRPRVGAVATGVIGFVGAVTGVITVISILASDKTSFSHLEMTATVDERTASEWVLPLSALDTDSPDGSPCGPEHIAWLEEHAERMERRLMLTVRNTAREGAMLALTDFRSDTPGAADRGPVGVRLVCDPSGVLPANLYYGRVDVDRPDLTARHIHIKPAGTAVAAPEIPIAYNLAPGETGRIPIELFSRNPVQGAIEVTVLNRDEEQSLTIEGSEFEMPALLFGGDMYLFTGTDGLECQHIAQGIVAPCTMEELRSEAEAAL